MEFENGFSYFFPVCHSSLKIIFGIVALDLLFDSYGWNVINIVSSYFDENRWFSEILCLQKFIDCGATKRRIFKNRPSYKMANS